MTKDLLELKESLSLDRVPKHIYGLRYNPLNNLWQGFLINYYPCKDYLLFCCHVDKKECERRLVHCLLHYGLITVLSRHEELENVENKEILIQEKLLEFKETINKLREGLLPFPGYIHKKIMKRIFQNSKKLPFQSKVV